MSGEELTLVILRGVPGAGKSTSSETYRAKGMAVVSRDAIRFTMYGAYTGVDEEAVTQVENAAISANLQSGTGVVVDGTNLNNKFLKTKLSLASRYGATVEFVDHPVPLKEAIARNAARRERGERFVGKDAVTRFFRRYKVNPETGELPAPPSALPEFPRYRADTTNPTAYIVDTDGTVASHDGVRSPYDTTRYAEDHPRRHVIAVVRALANEGHRIIGMSGRDAAYREVTQEWWTKNGIPFHEFLMRPKGDGRMDAIVKNELFESYVARRYNVLGAFDDRPQVIRMWETKGVNVLNVGDGREF